LVAALKSFSIRINGTVVSPAEYKIVTQQVNLSLEKNSSVIMVNKIRTYRPLIEVRYTTIQNQCPKCLGVKIVDDIKYNTKGDITTVDKELQLIQNVEKYIVTRIGSNIFHTWFGTNLHSMIGTKIGNFDLLKSQILEQISSAINKLKDIQRQLVGSGRTVDPGELFAQMLSTSVEQDTTDPSIVHVLIRFTAQSGKQLEYEQLLEFSQLRTRLAY
jgi:phage baseplate assembly protein W